jgi:hypothetical protein
VVTIFGSFALNPIAAAAFPEIPTAIAHLRAVLGDHTYESLADKGSRRDTFGRPELVRRVVFAWRAGRHSGPRPPLGGLLTVSPDEVLDFRELLIDRAKCGTAFLTKISHLGLDIRQRRLGFGQA